VVRWQAIGLALAIAVALLAYGAVISSSVPDARAEDLAFVVLAAVPGAVVGGRLIHGLVYFDAYGAQPAALLDLSRGSLSLVGAVFGGTLTAAYVCRLVGASIRPWADAAAIPLLLAIGLGKLTMVLGGAGQGEPFDGSWALAFGGGGSWTSAAAATAAHPSQVYESLWALAALPLWAVVRGRLGKRWRGTGLLLLAALAWWLLGRLLVAFTWRDPPLVLGLGGEQLATLLALLAVLGIAFGTRIIGNRRAAGAAASEALGPFVTGTSK
jgi:phosphatidylglycerol---prolipoprotein diacylglyceryl transferase